ncbi:glutamate ABC transporter substrate-binding protein [Streptomyces lonarensis]|uniref:Glutamate ABC transporter substrate-binding protein n=1 Tax=Streptomyces lonarensis TaxID=700599 RepID=A0A7X6D0I7_9ACTN|nr:glutamate ABC transporter substrate-binding protein [Streptomyces lonarensis]NJQ05860.1 glutamate ABC transporter substrate-binding protein [Streptomyces lonarensis]
MRVRKSATLAASALVLALTATACGSDDSNGGSSDGGDSNDTLTIGIKYDQPGLGLQTADGDFTGFDVDIARYVAAELGVEEDDITWRQAQSPERENMIKNGDVDFIVATYSITDQRKEEVSFAGPYFVAAQDLLMRSGESISSNDEIGDLNLCSVSGSTSAQKIQEDIAPDANLQPYGGYSECLTGLENGAVDALTTDNTILAGYAAQDEHQGKFELAGLDLGPEHYGIGIPKDDTELQEKINAALEKMFEDGAWAEAVEKNLGPAGFEVPDAPEITEGK